MSILHRKHRFKATFICERSSALDFVTWLQQAKGDHTNLFLHLPRTSQWLKREGTKIRLMSTHLPEVQKNETGDIP